jgi:hypothetical protein
LKDIDTLKTPHDYKIEKNIGENITISKKDEKIIEF